MDGTPIQAMPDSARMRDRKQANMLALLQERQRKQNLQIAAWLNVVKQALLVGVHVGTGLVCVSILTIGPK